MGRVLRVAWLAALTAGCDVMGPGFKEYAVTFHITWSSTSSPYSSSTCGSYCQTERPDSGSFPGSLRVDGDRVRATFPEGTEDVQAQWTPEGTLRAYLHPNPQNPGLGYVLDIAPAGSAISGNWVQQLDAGPRGLRRGGTFVGQQ